MLNYIINNPGTDHHQLYFHFANTTYTDTTNNAQYYCYQHHGHTSSLKDALKL